MRRTALDELGNYAIEWMIGVLELAMGQCLPEAPNLRSFPP